jgi:hypothetical protein
LDTTETQSLKWQFNCKDQAQNSVQKISVRGETWIRYLSRIWKHKQHRSASRAPIPGVSIWGGGGAATGEVGVAATATALKGQSSAQNPSGHHAATPAALASRLRQTTNADGAGGPRAGWSGGRGQGRRGDGLGRAGAWRRREWRARWGRGRGGVGRERAASAWVGRGRGLTRIRRLRSSGSP